jgi:hypothetical protein
VWCGINKWEIKSILFAAEAYLKPVKSKSTLRIFVKQINKEIIDVDVNLLKLKGNQLCGDQFVEGKTY